MRDATKSDADNLSRGSLSLMRFADFVLSLDACTLARASGDAIPLTRGEFALLKMFVTRPGRVIRRDTLLDALTGRRFEPYDRSVDVLVGKLRRKIEPNPKQPRLIVTVPGEGYRFDGLRFTPPETSQQAEEDSVLKSEASPPAFPWSSCPSPISVAIRSKSILSTASRRA